MQLLLSLQERRLSHIKLLLWSSGKNIGSELEVGIRKVTVVQWYRQWVRTSGGLKFKSGKSLWSSGKDNGSELQVDSSSNQDFLSFTSRCSSACVPRTLTVEVTEEETGNERKLSDRQFGII
ncbi:uncharacterized protein LOC144089861 isoform X2 [Stigmatopora argus]